MFEMYVDGGGNASVPTYFSYLLHKNGKPVKGMHRERWLLRNLIKRPPPQNNIPDGFLLPEGCCIKDAGGKETSNIAEYAALYYGLSAFLGTEELKPLVVWQDSKLVVEQVNGDNNWACRAPHLKPWLKAVLSVKWDDVDLRWIDNLKMKEVIGH